MRSAAYKYGYYNDKDLIDGLNYNTFNCEVNTNHEEAKAENATPAGRK